MKRNDIYNDLSANFLNAELYGNKRNRYTVPARNDLNDSLVCNIGLDYVIPYGNGSMDNKCPFNLEWSPDNAQLALATNDSIDIFESNSGELLYSITESAHVISMVVWFNKVHKEYDTSLPEPPSKKDIPSHLREITSRDSYKNTLESPYRSIITCSLGNTINIYENYRLKMNLIENDTEVKEHKDWAKSLALTDDDTFLLSGFASSSICGWDMNVGKSKFRINKSHSGIDQDLNTINSLRIFKQDSNVFLSGARNGSIRMWDMRVNTIKPLFHLHAHNKLNQVQVTADERQILSSGRDGAIRLWDVRTITQDPRNSISNFSDSKIGTTSPSYNNNFIREFRGHICSSYNIGCTFINNDRHIVTGSEDHCIYIYETESAKIVKKSCTHKSAVHLVQAARGQSNSFNNDFRVATNSIESCNIHVYAPQIKEKEEENKEQSTIGSKYIGVPQPDESDVRPTIKGITYIQRITMEKLMKKFGDQIFSYYHKNQISPSNAGENEGFNKIYKKIEKEFYKEFAIETANLTKRLGKKKDDIVNIFSQDINIEDILQEDNNSNTNLNNNNNNNNKNNNNNNTISIDNQIYNLDDLSDTEGEDLFGDETALANLLENIQLDDYDNEDDEYYDEDDEEESDISDSE